MKKLHNKPLAPDTQEKYRRLLELIRTLGKTAVAYSGGVHSAFLLAAAKEAPAEDLIALTIKRSYHPEWELEESRTFAERMGVTQRIIKTSVDKEVRNNATNRCYICKSGTFKCFREEMKQLGFDTLVDGTNADDTGEYRPGLRAIKENGVRSPLLEAGLTKNEIRQLSRQMGLPDWDKPSNTCLVTRIPYNTHVRDEDLRMIEKAEFFLMKEGFRQIRVRKHGDLARIEVDPGMIRSLFEKDKVNKIVPYLKSLGFNYISLDLEGYKTGSLDKNILK